MIEDVEFGGFLWCFLESLPKKTKAVED